MKDDLSLRRARVCAVASALLLAAVITAGGMRSARESAPLHYAESAPAQEIAVFAADRNTLRESELRELRAMAEHPDTSDSVRSSAQTRIMELMRWMELETAISDVLSARGYELPVVTVHADSVNVVLRAGELTREEAGVILELVTRETGITGGNVKIIPIN